jgi:hypothetical protein
MPEPLEAVLRMVEEGRLTAEEAASILAALDDAPDPTRGGPAPSPSGRPTGDRSSDASAEPDRGRWVKVEVTDGDRTVVNLKLPASLGELAMRKIPGLADEEVARIREALRTGLRGDILRVLDESGTGVRIVVE